MWYAIYMYVNTFLRCAFNTELYTPDMVANNEKYNKKQQPN